MKRRSTCNVEHPRVDIDYQAVGGGHIGTKQFVKNAWFNK